MTSHTWNITILRDRRQQLQAASSEFNAICKLAPFALMKQLCDESYRNGQFVEIEGPHVRCYCAGERRMDTRLVFDELLTVPSDYDLQRLSWKRSAKVPYGFIPVPRPYIVFRKIVVPRIKANGETNQAQ